MSILSVAVRTFLILVLLLGLSWSIPRNSSINTSSRLQKQFSIPYQARPFAQRVVALGDLHGDFDNALVTLRLARLVDNRGVWIGGSDILVQTGDIVDRGRDTIALYSFMQRIRAEAHAAGGAVISLLGNHEFMNAMGDWRYVTPDDIESFQGEKNRRYAMSTNGWLGKEWIANYSVNARISYPDLFPPLQENTLLARGAQSPLQIPALKSFFANTGLHFVHGGISYDWATRATAKTSPIDHINSVGKSLFQKSSERLTQARSFSVPPNANHEEADFYSADGPVWYRGYSGLLTDEICEEARKVANVLNVRRLVVGHTPHDRITSRCNGTIITIDTGISKAYNGIPSIAEFLYTLSPLPVQNPTDSEDKPVTRTWLEVERVNALSADLSEPVELTREQRVVQLSV